MIELYRNPIDNNNIGLVITGYGYYECMWGATLDNYDIFREGVRLFVEEGGGLINLGYLCGFEDTGFDIYGWGECGFGGMEMDIMRLLISFLIIYQVLMKVFFLIYKSNMTIMVLL